MSFIGFLGSKSGIILQLQHHSQEIGCISQHHIRTGTAPLSQRHHHKHHHQPPFAKGAAAIAMGSLAEQHTRADLVNSVPATLEESVPPIMSHYDSIKSTVLRTMEDFLQPQDNASDFGNDFEQSSASEYRLDLSPIDGSDNKYISGRRVSTEERLCALKLGASEMGENEMDSPLSEAVSSPMSPPLELRSKSKGAVNGTNGPSIKLGERIETQDDNDISQSEDQEMGDAQEQTTPSHYPRRKRTSIFKDLSESKIEIPTSIRQGLPTSSGKAKSGRQNVGASKGVTLGHWRDSPAPDNDSKHAVIGFIDIRDRLRTRIQHTNKTGEYVSDKFPLPPGPGGSWVTFDRIHFLDYLVGLDHYQIKEYVKLRSATTNEPDEDREEAIKTAVKDAIDRGRENSLLDNVGTQPLMAYGEEVPTSITASLGRPYPKRQRTSSSFIALNGDADDEEHGSPTTAPALTDYSVNKALREPLDPLYGTRPTRIIIGYWRGSSEENPDNRHAVCGILGQNDMFRVKVLRETRDGRFMDGNFPSGAGALWIHYEEVVFEPHLQKLTRIEVKEYCRVRQHQLDQGEVPEDIHKNELKAVEDARYRASAASWQPNNYVARSFTAAPPNDKTTLGKRRASSAEHEPRQLRRVDSRPEIRAAPRQSLNDADIRNGKAPTTEEALERTTALARREMARAEAAQKRSDRNTTKRDQAAEHGPLPSSLTSNGIPPSGSKSSLYESEEMQRLNQLWARQESARMKSTSSPEDAKMHDGVKYERKATGPFMGKLVSQGTIISIDGEDYVEYRVLTKPTFF